MTQGVASLQAGQHLGRVVGRLVVGNDDLEGISWQSLLVKGLEQLLASLGGCDWE